jgi:hypothetical protein
MIFNINNKNSLHNDYLHSKYDLLNLPFLICNIKYKHVIKHVILSFLEVTLWLKVL